jgi:serine/threonine protein kinase
MKLLFENWRNHLNEGLEERYEKFFKPKGWYFESEILLGEGGYGKVWRATNIKTGQRAAIKVLPIGMDLGYAELKIELENYEFLKNNRNSMPKEVAKHFPDVYETGRIVNRIGYVIMELLEKMPTSVGNALFGVLGDIEARKVKTKRILVDPEVLSQIFDIVISDSYFHSNIYDKLQKLTKQEGQAETFEIIEETAKEAFRVYISGEEAPILPGFVSGGGSLFKIFFKDDEEKRVGTFILDATLKMLSRLYENFDEAVTGELNDTLGEKWDTWFLRSFGNTVSERLKGQLAKSVIPTQMSNRSQYDVRKTAFPEAESLFNAMDYVHKDEFVPGDVHGRNVMVRPNTNELVIVDVGLFDLMREG